MSARTAREKIQRYVRITFLMSVTLMYMTACGEEEKQVIATRMHVEKIEEIYFQTHELLIETKTSKYTFNYEQDKIMYRGEEYKITVTENGKLLVHVPIDEKEIFSTMYEEQKTEYIDRTTYD